MNLCSYAHLIFDKDIQNIWWRKHGVFNKCCWENWIFTRRKLKLDHVFHPVQISTQSGWRTLL
jgi:hypothetical protein